MEKSWLVELHADGESRGTFLNESLPYKHAKCAFAVFFLGMKYGPWHEGGFGK